MTNPTHNRVALQPAYILHTRPYRDSSCIADVLTQDYGRMALLVRGARGKRNAAFKGGLQPFTPLLISWIGKGELPMLTELEAVGLPVVLSAARVIEGIYLNELLTRLLERGESMAGIYHNYHSALQGLAHEPATERILRLFEKELLQELGYGVILDVEGGGAPIQSELWYRYEIENGPRQVAAPPTKDAILGASLLSFARRELADAQSLRDAKKLMRRLMAPHLGLRPLHSRQLARALMELKKDLVV
ncbi:MAG: DNA repair protein RecO [Pseudomonadota bacterium]